jgi:hypothetical protein
MSIPSSGPLRMSQIRTALGVSNTNFRLKLAETGSYGALNSNSAIVGGGSTQLNGQAPHAMSKWRGYNNACTPVAIGPSATTINQGQSVTLTASGATSYSWNTGQTTAQITVTPLSSTTYTVTGITSGCKNTTASRTITVIPATTTTTTTTTSTTTTTTAPPPPSGCICWELIGGRDGDMFGVTDCNGEYYEIFVGRDEVIYRCAQDARALGGGSALGVIGFYEGCEECMEFPKK